MRLCRDCYAALLSAAFLAATAAPAAFASNVHRAPTNEVHHTRRHRSIHHRSYRHHARVRGQQAIQPERVEQIQQALIRAHYLSGEPSGKWDTTTVAAMQKYQAEHGWQTKIMPDSRALVKLGLGEDYSDAINAKNLTLATPSAGAPVAANQVAGFAAASGVSQ